INFAAHLTNLSEGHKISADQVFYYRERARGGCGLITTEELSVHPSDLAYEKLVDAFDPEAVPGFQKLTRTIHGYDTRIFAQLNHNGMQADGKNSRRAVWGPSAGKDPIFRETCQAMELEDIQECVDYFGRSAALVVEGGFDGIELQLGHSSLIRQFLSPATNQREDAYGGPLEKRLRFAREVIAAVRRAVGPDFTLGVRLNADEMHPRGGLTHEDAKQVAVSLEGTGQIDFIDISLGTFHHLFLVEGSMHTPLAYTLPLSAGIRSVVKLPVYASNRINDPRLAEKVLEDGQGDMVNMVRALIADPELPNKARQGREEDIRHCIACNQGCIGRIAFGRNIGCLQTPAAGNERALGGGTLVPARQPKRVVVVGAGPAGLEAARVAALRRHAVILLEKKEEVGGQNLLAARAAGRQEIQGVSRWLGSQVRKLDIDLRLGTEATVEKVLAERPEAVVVAAGSTPKEKPFPGDYGSPEVVTTWQILSGEMETGQKVLLIDLNGHHQGTGTAEFLADLGKSVHLITPALFPGSALGPLQDLYLTRQRLARKGVALVDFEGYETVVLAAGNTASDGLYFDLKGKVPEIYRIGDCLAPRLTDMAIADGHRVGRML
ncbi:MAG: FAD-dependent oxidoreductase, partial [Desulfobacterota bacterium]|nr:FAD-dependent oxidoreductase [Thermodesulfobacteriota bacterium]